MALDGAYLHHMKKEIEDKLLGGRVDKIYQPTRDELVIGFRTREEHLKLLLSARPDTARVHLTQVSLENPKQPPMLCMLLRKRLQSAKLLAVRQEGLERVLKMDFDAVNDLGDHITLTLVVEIMGKHSNIILVSEEGKIIEALRRVDAEMSSERLVFPGLLYRDPPGQDKLCILDVTSGEVLGRIRALPGAMTLAKALMAVLQGISPIVSRELEHISGRGQEVITTEMTPYQENRLLAALDTLRDTVALASGEPCTVITNKPVDFSFMGISQYGNAAVIRQESSFSTLLDRYYAERDRADRMRVKSGDILKLLSNRSERLARKINNQRAELQKGEEREEKRMMADLLNASLYAVPKSASSVKLINYFAEDCPEIEIKLDPALNPSQNAQRYYRDYRKAKTAEGKLTEQIALAEEELRYVETIFYALTEAQTEQDLTEIRSELTDQGYIRAQKGTKPKRETIAKPLSFQTSDGFTVLVGRNNKQNDKLTMKDAGKNDLWFHTKNIPGSHTILVTEGREPTENAMGEAALLAAKHSKAKDSAQVPVDYTKVRYVSKPQGAKPGMVIYVNQKTLYVNPAQTETD